MKMGEIRLDNCCRLCLKEGFSLTNIFSHRSAAGDQLYRILNFIYELKIFENDGLPSQICSPCMWRMIEFNICKRNVRSAEAEIMRLLNRTKPRPEEAQNNSLVAKTEDTELDGASEVVTECDTVHPESPEEPYNDSLLTTAEVAEMDGASEVGIYCDTVHSESTGSSDIKDFINLEASEERIGYSFDGESSFVFGTQDISDKNRDKGRPWNYLRGDVVPEEESSSAELSKPILDVTKSEVFPLKPPLSESRFICDVCEKSFTSKRCLGNHIRLHNDERPFKCNICDKAFKQNAGRHQHELKHIRDNISFGKSEKESKNNQYNCSICAKNFSTKRGLYRHSKVHSDKHKCNSCGKCFQSNANLRKHEQIHTKEKPFKCEICFKCFLDMGRLNSHLRVHSSEKPFSCEFCDKKFKRNSYKVQHELLHFRKNNIPNC